MSTTEVSIGDYGRMVFETMLREDPAEMPAHWRAIGSSLYRLRSQTVLRAPPDWEQREEEYCSDEYWIRRAGELGL